MWQGWDLNPGEPNVGFPGLCAHLQSVPFTSRRRRHRKFLFRHLSPLKPPYRTTSGREPHCYSRDPPRTVRSALAAVSLLWGVDSVHLTVGVKSGVRGKGQNCRPEVNSTQSTCGRWGRLSSGRVCLGGRSTVDTALECLVETGWTYSYTSKLKEQTGTSWVSISQPAAVHLTGF